MPSSIYEKPVLKLMQEMAADLAPTPGVIFSRQQAVEWFQRHYPKIKRGTVTAHLVRLSTNVRSRLHHNVHPGDDDVFYQVEPGHYRRYQPETDPLPIHHDAKGGEDASRSEEEETVDTQEEEFAGSREFAYEADLKSYLSRNLGVIEKGLDLYEEEGVSGVEFPVGGRFIDLLAVDAEGSLVVIELKVSRGYDRVVGQLMRYVAWIKRNLATDGQKVRGIIIARQISDDLRLACSLLPDVQLLEYSLSLTLRQVDTSDG